MSKELKALDYIVKEFLSYEIPEDAPNCVKELETIRKALKALEIIKEKDADVGWLKRAKDLHQYNSGVGIGSYSALTSEEYELLREVLK